MERSTQRNLFLMNNEVVKNYFSAEEWEEIPEIVKIRHLNMYINYKKCIAEDWPYTLPSFMKPDQAKRVSTTPEEHARLMKKKSKKQKENIAPKIQTPKVLEIRKKPKRNIPAVNYEEKEVLPLDHYIFCDKCQETYEDFCPTCGQLKHIFDTPVPFGTTDRAKLTCPSKLLEIRPSKIHGFGVFAKKNVPEGVRMGPYEGIETVNTGNAEYGWELKNGRIVDAQDEKNSNWLRFVNCAAHQSEQNLVAFQFKEKMYYRTAKEINAGEELLVYYGARFATLLGIPVKDFFKPKIAETLQVAYQCDFCCCGFSEVKYWQTHKLRCQNDPENKFVMPKDVFTCEKCNITVTSQEYLSKHMKRCKGKDISRGTAKENPESTLKTEKKFPCTECPFQTNYSCILKTHVKIHTKQKPFACKQCNYKSVRKGTLTVHERTHSKEKLFGCATCEKGFNHKCHLLRHMISQHSYAGHTFSCKLCSYKTVNNSHLKRHIKYKHDTQEREFSCAKCAKQFVSKANLRIHESKHTGIMPFKCTKCNYESAQLCNLKRHVKYKHTYVKDYQCEYCFKTFVTKSEMKVHIRIHTGKKPFVC